MRIVPWDRGFSFFIYSWKCVKVRFFEVCLFLAVPTWDLCLVCPVFPLSLLYPSALLWWAESRMKRSQKDLGVMCTIQISATALRWLLGLVGS